MNSEQAESTDALSLPEPAGGRTSSLRSASRGVLNGILGKFNCRLINANWGPRGFLHAFQRVRKLGAAPRLVLDGGASTGVWTRQCLSVFPEASYLLIDPLEENVAPLSQLAANPRVQYWRGVLASSAGEIPFHLHGDQSSPLASQFSQDPATLVPARTLDSFLGNELDAPPDLIKLDVQGYELEILKGAEECLRSTEFLLLELSYRQIYEGGPLAHEVIAYLGERGFRIYDICTYTQRNSDGELAQSDVLFARETSRVFQSERWT